MTAIGAKENPFQLNKRILSVVMFTFVCYLTIGLPLAVLPGFVHNHLGYNSVLAGLIISAQYFATLFSRPHAGRYADQLGPKKVVLFGLACCGASGVFYALAFWFDALPWLSLLLLCLGRVLLGIGESFASTGSTLWGIGLVGPLHTARVISWNGVATYGAMAAGAPLGVYLNQHWGLAGVAALIALAVALSLLLASGKPSVSISAGRRIAFSAVFGRIWAYGLGLALGTVGFGVIATFITLYYADKGWSGAAFSLTLFSCAFVGIRLIFSNSINRHGGLKVTLASFLVEILGLLLIWQAGDPLLAQAGALLAGAGFSLVFPALGVEAVKQVPQQNQGTALGTYSAFLDLALGITGPLAGLLMSHMGVPSIYLAAALWVAMGALLTLRLLQRGRA
ncbi:MFS transporter [Serratia ficaria]|uniref:MFS transporter n=1 Tax=Serratia ficaria TaxID=61651 RepID=UPI00077CB975|nr:MFS transporter [Serratia ficaria]MEE4484750.1 MFS transporter [Serratia ficaria]CAI1142513.1 major facilitator superfamily transporter [Serratia ficaria]CAI1160127.1 major facilitator superfamily transporter [Serratia ficaria]CAI1524677.1 major facilitator superfamily transporter [Serratia ficaria]CAI1829791.1 major facilitator superfamily transporter [Serratia ficaria]